MQKCRNVHHFALFVFRVLYRGPRVLEWVRLLSIPVHAISSQVGLLLQYHFIEPQLRFVRLVRDVVQVCALHISLRIRAGLLRDELRGPVRSPYSRSWWIWFSISLFSMVVEAFEKFGAFRPTHDDGLTWHVSCLYYLIYTRLGRAVQRLPGISIASPLTIF